MHAEPALAAVLDDPARTNRLAGEGVALVDRWRALPVVAALDQGLAALADGPPASAQEFATALAPWLSGRDWLDPLLDDALAAMRADEFASPGIGLIASPVVPGLALFHHPPVSLSLLLVDGAALMGARADRLTFERGYCLLHNIGRDSVSAERWSAECDTEGVWRARPAGRITLASGDHITVDSWHEQLRILPPPPGSVPGDAVLLRYALAGSEAGGRIRDHALADGAQVRSGIADAATSRILMLLWLARQADAAALAGVLPPLLAHADPMVRWESARLWASRDPAAARAAIYAMAQGDADEAVRAAASATLEIIDAHLLRQAA